VKVAFVGAFAIRLADRVKTHLTLPCDVILADEAAIVSRIPDVDAVVTLAFTREMGTAARCLRLVQVPGAGLDRIDRSALPDGASLANAYGHETGIAEYVLGAMLALRRSFGTLDAALRRGNWESQWAVGVPAPPVWPELAGQTLGILGYGRIGRRVARLALAFDMTVRAIRQSPTEHDARELAFLGGADSLDDVLRSADYLAITLPLTPATRGLLGERELELMKPTAILVNVARAEILDEDALYHALARGTIAGAALDVWYRYPTAPGPVRPSNRPFHELPNVLMTPHVAGWTEGTLDARARLIAENIGRVARDEAPLNLILPPVGS
jgi:phosphoglycerate dehydrogenase-like enzyme